MIGVEGQPWWTTKVRYDHEVILLILLVNRPGTLLRVETEHARTVGARMAGARVVGARMVASDALDGRLIGQRAFGGVDIRFGALRY